MMKNLPEGFDREGVRGAIEWLSTLPQTALVVNPENGKLQNIESAAGYTRRLLKALNGCACLTPGKWVEVTPELLRQKVHTASFGGAFGFEASCNGSGCNYPEGECLGHCVLSRLTKNKQ